MAKVRSPNYPTLSLPEAIDRIRTIYSKEHRHPVDKLVVAQALGYGSVNGASMSVISALLKYGLLENVGTQLRVSNQGEDVSIYAPGDKEWVTAVADAGIKPVLFEELYAEYGERLPSDNALRAYLIKHGFNQNAVAGVIRSYRDTIEYLNEYTNEPSNGVEPSSTIVANPSLNLHSEADPRSAASGSLTMSSGLPNATGDELVLSFKLSTDTQVRSVFSGTVTQEAIKKFIQLLELSADTFPTAGSLSEEKTVAQP